MQAIKKNIDHFDLRKIMNSGQIFRMYENPEGSFIVFSGNKKLKLIQNDEEVCFCCSEEEFTSYWENYFDLKRDYAGIVKKAADKKGMGAEFLKNACDYASDIRVLNQDIWEMMISFIISQQKQIPSIRKCIEALCRRFGEKHSGSINDNDTEEEIWYGFPTAEKIASAGPSGVEGLSLGYREKYIYGTAVKYLKDGIPDSDIRKMSYEDVKKYLCSFPGIGEKVADCVCLFGCGFTDAFPIDVHIKDILYREFICEQKKKETEDKLKSGSGSSDVSGLPRKKLLDSLSYSEYMSVTDTGFSDFKGVRGIVQQWIFAYELFRNGR
ncbi:MAG: hypothetical protein IKP88_01975 [Lachnospiraceae bacterium]|nr:hypothetical protein [Lachnospiraceae bacterium]